MDQDSIKRQLKSWLTRKTPSGSVRVVNELSISIASDVGLIRVENQDKVVLLKAQVTPVKSFLVGVLCDGMGGMVDGAECASLAISSFISSCIRNRSLDVNQRILCAVNDANNDVFIKYEGDGGSTLSAFILDSDGNSSAVNVGDSRIYAVINSTVKQLSIDDTIEGQLNREVEGSSMSNKLLQYIGIGDELEIHQLELPELTTINKLVLTSDGAHYLNPTTFNSLLTQDISPIELAKRLILVSKWCGGHDNTTTIVLSNPSSIFNNSISALTGTVQLWDSSGDVCLIGIERSQSIDDGQPSNQLIIPEVKDEKLSNNDNSKDDLFIENNISNTQKNSQSSKLSPVVENSSLKNKKKKNKSEKNKDIPQLRIDFDE